MQCIGAVSDSDHRSVAVSHAQNAIDPSGDCRASLPLAIATDGSIHIGRAHGRGGHSALMHTFLGAQKPGFFGKAGFLI